VTERNLSERFPPSEPCLCAVGLGSFRRPGWRRVAQAAAALEADWRRAAGRDLVDPWCRLTGLWDHLERYGLARLESAAPVRAGRGRS
jgi:hypothetical protein